MNCIKFKECQNAIYPHKCKSCGSGMINFVDKNSEEYNLLDECVYLLGKRDIKQLTEIRDFILSQKNNKNNKITKDYAEVKILKSKLDTMWYANSIGETFEIEKSRLSRNPVVYYNNMYRLNKDDNKVFIYIEDCKIVE